MEADLIERLAAGLGDEFELSERERTLLALATEQAHDLVILEADIAEFGARVPGQRPGHEVLNPAIAEARRARAALAALLKQLKEDSE